MLNPGTIKAGRQGDVPKSFLKAITFARFLIKEWFKPLTKVFLLYQRGENNFSTHWVIFLNCHESFRWSCEWSEIDISFSPFLNTLILMWTSPHWVELLFIQSTETETLEIAQRSRVLCLCETQNTIPSMPEYHRW